jgi:hypothetical protein
MCESCGGNSDDAAPVLRMYVIPADWDREGSETVLDDIEHWCFSCRSQYPNIAIA